MLTQMSHQYDFRLSAKKGCLQVYTGEGKGKTTAAVGLALRAFGAGWRVFMGQFLKKRPSSEVQVLRDLGERMQVRCYGVSDIVCRPPDERDRAEARRGLAEVDSVLRNGDFHLVILDEVNVALHYQLFSVERLLMVLDGRAPASEVVITGRQAHPKLLDAADLVTEMREVKHYYYHGLGARKGIEY